MRASEFTFEDAIPKDGMEKAVDVLSKAYRIKGRSIQAAYEGKTTLTALCQELNDPFFIQLVSHKDINLFNKYGELYNNFNKAAMWKIFSKESDMPYINDMMKDPEYAAREKGRTFKIVEMSPYAYQLATNTGFNDDTFEPVNKLVWEYALKTLDGSPMPIASLEYSSNGQFSQEGRHRAAAAKLLDVYKMPVVIIAVCKGDNCKEFQQKVFKRYEK